MFKKYTNQNHPRSDSSALPRFGIQQKYTNSKTYKNIKLIISVNKKRFIDISNKIKQMLETQRGCIQPKFLDRNGYNPAFKSLSYKGKLGYTNYFPIKAKYINEQGSISRQQQQQQHQQQQQQQTKAKVYGAILVGKNPQTNEPLYALVQGRYTRKWSFPKGHSDETETPLECAMRELIEETGINDLPSPNKYIKLIYGYYYVFNVSTNLRPLTPRDKREITDAKWVTLKEIDEMDVNADVCEFKKIYSDII